MDKSTALGLAKEFTKLVVMEFNPSKVILYGSYANDKWHSESDIDIAVIVEELKHNYLESLNLLYKMRRKVDSIIEPVLIIKDKDPSGFMESIESYGEVLYNEV